MTYERIAQEERLRILALVEVLESPYQEPQFGGQGIGWSQCRASVCALLSGPPRAASKYLPETGEPIGEAREQMDRSAELEDLLLFAERLSKSKTEIIDALIESLSDILSLIDEGVLVRDTSKDHEPTWAMAQVPLVKALVKARQLLPDKVEMEDNLP